MSTGGASPAADVGCFFVESAAAAVELSVLNDPFDAGCGAAPFRLRGNCTHTHTRTHRVELASAFVANSYAALAMRLPPCTVQTCCLLPTNIPQEHYSRGQGCRNRLHTCSVPSLNELLASIVTSSSFWTALVPFTPLPLPFRDGPAPFVFESNTELRELPPGRTGYVTPRPLEDWTCKRFIR